jgi:hypothetical protein
MGEGWNAHIERERTRYEDGLKRLPDDSDARQRQLTRVGNAAYGAGLAKLMLGDREEARTWLSRAADAYRASYADAPPASWGRLVAILKTGLLAGGWPGDDAAEVLDKRAQAEQSPIGRYAVALALLILGFDEGARPVASSLRARDDFPHDVADALTAIAAKDTSRYTPAIESVLESFEQRDEYLEDVPVADTVVVLQLLAAEHGLEADLSSPLLPP